jgi:hypothetical protein
MSEVKVVKFNLKTFSQDYIFYEEVKDKEQKRSLEEDFKVFYVGASDNIKLSVIKYLEGCPLVMGSRGYLKFLHGVTGCDFAM